MRYEHEQPGSYVVTKAQRHLSSSSSKNLLVKSDHPVRGRGSSETLNTSILQTFKDVKTVSGNKDISD